MDEDNIDIITVGQTQPYFIDTKKIKRLVKSLMESLGISAFEISIQFTCPLEMKKLNHQFRNKDRSTDVLSFPQMEFSEPITVENTYTDSVLESPSLQEYTKTIGDIVVSLEDAQQNSQKIGHQIDKEICFLLIHGLLHLCGHDHQEKKDEDIMIDQQKKLLKSLSSQPIPDWNGCVEVSS